MSRAVIIATFANPETEFGHEILPRRDCAPVITKIQGGFFVALSTPQEWEFVQEVWRGC
jgi:hypothetical protein